MNIPERVRPYLAHVLFALLIGLFWSVARFPYQALAERLAWSVGATGRVQLVYESAGPTLLPPGLVYTGATLKGADGRVLLTARRLRVRPVWSALLRGRLGVAAQADALGGTIDVRATGDGLTAPSNIELQISLAGLDLSGHPALKAAKVGGRLGGQGDLRLILGRGVGLAGQADVAVQGLTAMVDSRMLARPAIGVSQARARLKMTDNRVVFEELKLGPGDLEGTLSGEILLGPDVARSPLLVRGAVVVDPGLVNMDAVGGPQSIIGDMLRNRRPLPVNYRGAAEGLGRMVP